MRSGGVDPGATERKLGAPVRQGYGLTEAGGTHQTFDGDEETDPASVGVLSAGTEARIVEPGTTRDAAVGELLVRGPQGTTGYRGDEEATRQAFVDGWLRTGDLVRVHNGRLPGRARGTGIVVAQASCGERPRAPDRVNGQVPKAFVVTEGDVTAEELMAFVAAEVAPFKKVRQVEFVAEIPKSVSGKILRRLLKEADECES